MCPLSKHVECQMQPGPQMIATMRTRGVEDASLPRHRILPALAVLSQTR